MLSELLTVVKLYVIRKARIIISDHTVGYEWGDVVLSTSHAIRYCYMPPYPKKQTPIWVLSPTGYFIYADYWVDLVKLYFATGASNSYDCVFYHQQYLSEILDNLRFVLVTDSKYWSLAWITDFHMYDMTFRLIMFNDHINTDDIMDQILTGTKKIDEIKQKIINRQFLPINPGYHDYLFAISSHTIKNLKDVPTNFIINGSTIFDMGSHIAEIDKFLL